MSIGRRDQRGRIYTYSSTDDTGVTTSVYTFSVERWCRVGNPSAREVTIAAQAGHRVSAVIAFADEVEIGNDDLIVVDSVRYLVRGPVNARGLREIRVMVETTDDSAPLLEVDES